jgi:putative nucleotidyltransferase with HDIG domain
VVDDEASIREVVAEFLQGSGFEVDGVSNGVEALEKLKSNRFDVALIDLEMPHMRGTELLEKIREFNGDLVSIMMTGFGTVETAIEAMKNGALDYILKPFKLEELEVMIRRGLSIRDLERENIHLKRTLSFYKVSEALGSDVSLETLLQMILETMHEEIDAEAVSLWLSEESGRFSRLSWKGKSFTWLEQTEAQLNLEAILGDVRRQEPILASGDFLGKYFKDLPQARLCSFLALPVKVKNKVIGLAFAYSIDSQRQFTEGERKALALLVSHVSSGIEIARLYEDLKRTFNETIEGLCKALEAKDPYTRGHSERVSRYVGIIAKALGLPQEDVEKMQQAGLFHDIGKIGVKESSLNKPESLTDEELLVFHEHPLKSKEILEPIHFLKDIVPMVYHHHEWYNGQGYPDKLKGEAIPLGARIICIADSYTVMTENRVYRKALTRQQAVEELRRCSGTQFDPKLVDLFIGELEHLGRT